MGKGDPNGGNWLVHDPWNRHKKEWEGKGRLSWLGKMAHQEGWKCGNVSLLACSVTGSDGRWQHGWHAKVGVGCSWHKGTGN